MPATTIRLLAACLCLAGLSLVAGCKGKRDELVIPKFDAAKKVHKALGKPKSQYPSDGSLLETFDVGDETITVHYQRDRRDQ